MDRSAKFLKQLPIIYIVPFALNLVYFASSKANLFVFAILNKVCISASYVLWIKIYSFNLSNFMKNLHVCGSLRKSTGLCINHFISCQQTAFSLRSCQSGTGVSGLCADASLCYAVKQSVFLVSNATLDFINNILRRRLIDQVSICQSERRANNTCSFFSSAILLKRTCCFIGAISCAYISVNFVRS